MIVRGNKINSKPPVGIVGIGSHVPERVLTNFDLEQIVDTSDEWIKTRTGIIQRRIANETMCTSDLASEAGRKALIDANVDTEDIDLIIVATASPDMIFPSTACLTQHKLGASCPAFDISAACTGFIYGLSVASQYIATGAFETILLIGADALTRYVNWLDRSTCILFGDGAGAVVLQRAEEGYGILANYLAADGSGSDLLKIPAGGALIPGSEKSVKAGLHHIHMSGNEVFKFAVRAISDAAKGALNLANLSIEDVDYFIPHQANKRIIETAVEKLKISPDKVVTNIHKYGNTSTASIPLALDEIWRGRKLKRGDILLFVGFGAGLTWGANVVRWSKEVTNGL